MRFLLFSLIILTNSAFAETTPYAHVTDLPYQEGSTDPYIQERCKLDVYHPKTLTDFATVIWFHGGGLHSGNKNIPEQLKTHGFAVVAVNYRLHPKVSAPAYIQDAAAAVAWVFQNIATYGGDPEKIIVSGHSAGGYLASMIGLDKSYLAAHDIDADKIHSLVPLSGNAITHFTIRKENGIPQEQPVINKFAPLFHVRSDAPPYIIITGDRERELLGRYEENAYMWRMMQIAKHKDTKIHELDGFDHGSMVAPGCRLLAEHVKRTTKKAVQ